MSDKTPEQIAAEKAAEEARKAETQKLIDDAVKAKEEELRKHIKELNDENAKKRFDKKAILEALGIEKEEGKTDIELINEKLSSTNQTLDQLTKQLEAEKAEKETLKKETKAIKAAEKYNFHNIDDVMKFVNLDAENIDDEFKKIVESKPYLVKQKQDFGSGFNKKPGEGQDDYTKAQELAKKYY